jgi:hypothetical protein
MSAEPGGWWTLEDAVADVVANTPEPVEGWTAITCLERMDELRPGAFPLCTVIDVADVADRLYGRHPRD